MSTDQVVEQRKRKRKRPSRTLPSTAAYPREDKAHEQTHTPEVHSGHDSTDGTDHRTAVWIMDTTLKQNLKAPKRKRRRTAKHSTEEQPIPSQLQDSVLQDVTHVVLSTGDEVSKPGLSEKEGEIPQLPHTGAAASGQRKRKRKRTAGERKPEEVEPTASIEATHVEQPVAQAGVAAEAAEAVSRQFIDVTADLPRKRKRSHRKIAREGSSGDKIKTAVKQVPVAEQESHRSQTVNANERAKHDDITELDGEDPRGRITVEKEVSSELGQNLYVQETSDGVQHVWELPTGIHAPVTDHNAIPQGSKEQQGKKDQERKTRPKSKKRKERLPMEASSGWRTSDPIGGRFLSTGPLFSKDEQFLIIATEREIFVYSTSTSLLVRKFSPASSSAIKTYVWSAANPDYLYVIADSKFLYIWDWIKGVVLRRLDIGAPVIAVATSGMEGSTTELVFTLELVETERGSRSVIAAHQLYDETSKIAPEVRILLQSRTSFFSFKVLLNGEVIVAVSKDTFTIGVRTPGSTSVKDLVYTWREIRSTESVTCFDVRATLRQPAGTSKHSQRSRQPSSSPYVVDVVLGGAEGAVYIYEDALERLIQSEDPGKSAVALTAMIPRRLHWHRDAVGAVKWSLDGNYVLSGGRETVLVLWQLETGKRQDLPHLTSAIDDIVVSPTGASYAIQLADNSVMVLSTTELKPTANIAGLQSQYGITHPTEKDIPQAASRANPSGRTIAPYRTVPAVLHPSEPTHLLLAVPASQPRTAPRDSVLPAPYLQTYDTLSAQHISRQALTRNNATNFITGPEATKLREPDVILMEVSHDGKWLATLEEWVPPASDLEFLAEQESMIAEQQSLRREIYLKFWHWDDQNQTWALETRIDAPHLLADGITSGRVFDLVAEPKEVGFATIGEDSFVRMWKPKTRLRDGSVVRGSHGGGLVTWSSRHAIELEKGAQALEGEADPSISSLPVSACLAYSPDGSILVACQELPAGQGSRFTHFIDPATGDFRCTLANLYHSGLVAMGVVDRYIILLSDDLMVWDLVMNDFSYGIELSRLHSRAPAQQVGRPLLAINHVDGTFAISLAGGFSTSGKSDQSRISPARIIVFEPTTPAPLHVENLPVPVVALLPLQSRKGYLALDSAAELRVLSPKAGAPIPALGSVFEPEQKAANVEGETEMDVDEPVEDVDVLAVESADSVARADQTPDVIEDVENDKPVVRPEQLAEIFDVGPSLALPPVRDLFTSVVDLFSRKPKVAASA